MPKFYFNDTELTEETLQKARDWFEDNALQCLSDALSGETKVNDIASYKDWCLARAYEARTGRTDHTFTFLQRAYYIQTGESVALLS